MRITPQPNERVALPLDTIVTFDMSALMANAGHPNGFIGNIFLYTGQGAPVPDDGSYRFVYSAESQDLVFIPGPDWQGFATGEADGENAAGVLSVGILGQGPVLIYLSPTPDPLADVSVGDDGDDRYTVAASVNLRAVDAMGGNDRITTPNGTPVWLAGNTGNDTLLAGNQNDAVMGGEGEDKLYGGGGMDIVDGDAGNDSLFGGAGTDVLTGGMGNDDVRAGLGDDTLIAGLGADVLRGEGGHDRFEIVMSERPGMGLGAASTLIYGGLGDDEVAGYAAPEGISTDLITHGTIIAHLGAGDDTFQASYMEGGTVYGGEGSDNLTATRHALSEETVRLFGGSGDDNLTAGNSSLLRGGTGNDNMIASNGSTLWGEAGDDSIATGQGDSLLGGTTIYGGTGNDTVLGGSVADVLHGGAENDEIHGGGGGDALYGGLGDDLIYGGHGADTLFGGPGSNTLTGGRDADTFFFRTIGDSTITDFLRGTDVAAFDAAMMGLGNGDTTIDDAMILGAPLDQWDSENELVFIDYSVGALTAQNVADTAGDHQRFETMGIKQLIFAIAGGETAIYLHEGDGAMGVDVSTLTLLALFEGVSGLTATDIDFV